MSYNKPWRQHLCLKHHGRQTITPGMLLWRSVALCSELFLTSSLKFTLTDWYWVSTTHLWFTGYRLISGTGFLDRCMDLEGFATTEF